MKRALILLLFSTTGCAAEVQPVDGASVGVREACDGRLGLSPEVLVTGIGSGSLLRAGDDALIHISAFSGGLVQRIDRCSGETTALTSLLHPGSGAVAGAFLYLLEPSESPDFSYLLRVPTAGGETELLTSVHGGRSLVADETRGVFILGRPDDDEHEASDRTLYRYDPATSELTAVLDLLSGDATKQFSLIGVTASGVYLKESFDCGCTPGYRRFPFEGDSLLGVKGSEGAGRFAIVNDAMVLARDANPSGFGSERHEIARVPFEGGDGEVLVPLDETDETGIRRLDANARAICWLAYSGTLQCTSSPEGGEVRVVDEVAEVDTPVVTAGDGVYWLRTSLSSADLDLVGAAP